MGVPVNVAGQITIGVAAALALGAVAAGLAGRRAGLTNLILGALCLTVGAMTMLLMALLRHDFGLAYVVRHTSLDLPRAYCFAALWAGQEGTILLWVAMLLAAALAVVTRAEAGRRGAGTVLAALAVGFFALLVIRSPFAPVTDGVPPDGQGLNPLLRNPWMIIHPPVLFAGYALLAVPFALAVAGFWRGDIDGWLEAARPWLLAAWFLLGAGMMLGAYWAYITLGWGGFWAWDPVENSSLIPWLFATTFLHAMLLHRRCGAFRRATYVLATLSFATVVYGSYLTRSGVLGEFSVHSFESLGRGYNALWLALLAAPLGAGLGLCCSRRRKSAGEPVPPALNLLAQATWLLALMSVFVLVGTSAPLLTGLLGKSSAVEPTFYNRTQTAFFGVRVRYKSYK